MVPLDWDLQITATDVLSFALLLQFAKVNRQLKQDMRIMAQRRGTNCGDLIHL